MKSEPRKQISLFIPLSDWLAMRNEAARQNIPLTELARRWLKPGIEEIPKHAASN